jgi:hypothetical protein
MIALASAGALRAETLKLAVKDTLALNASLTALDGFDREISQGKDLPSKIIRGGYSFNAKTAWAIADDLAETKRAQENYDSARLAAIKEISPDGTGDAIDKSPALAAKFSEKMRAVLDLVKPINLTLISRDDLNLEVNKMIPGSVLAGLAPVIQKP